MSDRGRVFYGGRRTPVPAEREEDCPKRMVFDPDEKMCYDISARKNNKKVADVAKTNIGRQNEKLEMAKLNKSMRTVEARFERIAAASKRYPKTWTLEPGDKGFNAEAMRVMQKAGVDKEPFEVTCPPQGQVLDKAKVMDQPYQKTAAFLFHPNTPVNRLLVAVRTGGGKTLIMIRALTNFYDDRRPKLVVFPNKTIRDQFYKELMAYDNPYRSFVLEELGAKASVDYITRSRKNKLTGSEIYAVQDILGMKNHPGQAGKPGHLAAPLRAVTYQELGGATLASMAWIRPKFGTKTLSDGRPNILEDKIVLMDEAQNLIKPNPEVQKLEASRVNLKRAREMLRLATASAVAFFTATPVIDEPTDGEKLMRIVRGVANENKPTHEGFITSFVSNPETAYPTVEPLAEEMPKLVSVPLSGDPDVKSSSLGNYLDHLLKGAQGKKVIDAAFLKSKTRDIYEYTSTYITSQTNAEFLRKLREAPDTVAPKLAAAARLAEKAEGKVILLTNSQHGFYSLYYIFQHCPEFAALKEKVLPLLGSKRKTTRADFKATCNGISFSNAENYEVCVRDKFDADDNVHGDKLKILVLNAEEYSEGIDFKDVRSVIMVDVPESWAKLKQRVGRAVRQCSHIRLSKNKWNVKTYVMCATLPPKVELKSGQEIDLSSVPTVDEQMLVRVMAQRAVIEDKTCDLVNVAADRKILKGVVGTDVCNRKRSNIKEEHVEAGPSKKQKDDMVEATKLIAKAHMVYKDCLGLAMQLTNPEKQTDALSKCSAKYQSTISDVVENLVPWYSSANNLGAINCPIGLDEEACVNYCDEELPITQDMDTGVTYNAKENALCRQRHNTPPRRGSATNAAATAAALTDNLAAVAFGDALRTAMPGANAGSKCENCPDGKTEEQCFDYCTNKGYGGNDLYKCVARMVDPDDNRTCDTSGRAANVRASTPPPAKAKKAKKAKKDKVDDDDAPIRPKTPTKKPKKTKKAQEKEEDEEEEDDDAPILKKKKRRGSQGV